MNDNIKLSGITLPKLSPADAAKIGAIVGFFTPVGIITGAVAGYVYGKLVAGIQPGTNPPDNIK